METLLKIILKTEVKDRLPFNHPMIKGVERRIGQYYKIHERIKKNCSEITSKALAKQICIGVITLAKYGDIPKAIQYALSFDEEFNMEKIKDDFIFNSE